MSLADIPPGAILAIGLVLGAVLGAVVATWINDLIDRAEDEPEWHRSQLPYDGIED